MERLFEIILDVVFPLPGWLIVKWFSRNEPPTEEPITLKYGCLINVFSLLFWAIVAFGVYVVVIQ